MIHDRRIAAILASALLTGPLWACGPQRIRMPEVRGSDFILLLSDPEGGATGRAAVSNPAGTVDLETARAFTRVSPNQAPTPVTLISEAEVRRIFGDALSALPPPPQRFTLHFRFESHELTEESRALVAEILQAAKKRPVPEVAVIGHTDTTGTPPSNFELGLKRAEMIRTFLIAGGLGASFIEVTSHGEGDPLVLTADEVLEPRNRRVEITIR